MKTTLLTTLLITVLAFTVNAADPTPAPSPAKLQDALAEVVKGVTQTAGEAKSFIVGQLPDVVKQLLAWKFAESIWKMVLPAIFLGVAIKIASVYRRKGREKGWKYLAADEEAESIAQCLGFIATHIVLLVTIIWFITSINTNWLQIWLAPKVYLIEYARSLTK